VGLTVSEIEKEREAEKGATQLGISIDLSAEMEGHKKLEQFVGANLHQFAVVQHRQQMPATTSRVICRSINLQQVCLTVDVSVVSLAIR